VAARGREWMVRSAETARFKATTTRGPQHGGRGWQTPEEQ
jgi:hypothetical protein